MELYTSTLLLTVVVFMPVQLLSILIHECGHLVALLLFNLPPVELTFGQGPLWLKFRCRGYWIYIRKQPYGAHIGIERSVLEGMHPATALIFYAAGPLFHFLFGLLLVVCGIWAVHTLAWHIVLIIQGLVVMFTAIKQLVPTLWHEMREGNNIEYQTDGYRIVQV